ncbi:MAG: aspartate aminotransferase family protein [Verrucomicrobiae bacterium]|nr:aspartate aminotransferase family protein [Verrucomicrobiae bacterium]
MVGTTQAVLQLLREFESRNVTFIAPDGSWPIVWRRARGVWVWDVEGKRYLDLTAAFGVAAAGHANPRVVRAGQRQMAELLHAMGDVHPHPLKAELARELSRITFERWERSLNRAASQRLNASTVQQFNKSRSLRAKTIFCNSGFEAVEAALKTAMLATGKPGVIAFKGAYHGLGYGALNVTERDLFRAPFSAQLRQFGYFVPFPAARGPIHCGRARRSKARVSAGDPLQNVERMLTALFKRKAVGAVLVEPVQGRGGINVPPPGFLTLLRKLCDVHGALLILDEIYTGFGRTGKWFACEHECVVPDIICLGKALTGGFPLSACVGRADLMDAAWPASTGEAIHTSTFLGHPVGCAMALAQIKEVERRQLPQRSAALGEFLVRLLRQTIRASKYQVEVRGLGLMVGVEIRSSDGSPATEAASCVVKAMLQRGFILLPEGEHGNVVAMTPPLTITRAQLARAVAALAEVLESL